MISLKDSVLQLSEDWHIGWFSPGQKRANEDWAEQYIKRFEDYMEETSPEHEDGDGDINDFHNGYFLAVRQALKFLRGEGVEMVNNG